MAHIYRILQLARTKYLNQYLLADRVQNIYFRLQNFLACMHALKMNKMVGLIPCEKFLHIIYIIEKRSALTPAAAGWRLVVEAPGEIAPSSLQGPHPPPRILGQAVINAPPVAIWCKAVHFLPPRFPVVFVGRYSADGHQQEHHHHGQLPVGGCRHDEGIHT